MELNPQQAEFLALFTNPNSETFGNAKKSALKAKYSETYADNITTLLPDWLLENIGDYKRLQKAEKVLDKILDMNPIDEQGKIDSSALKTQADVAKFAASTIGKKKYSTRVENTGANGESLVLKVINYEGNNNTPSV